MDTNRYIGEIPSQGMGSMDRRTEGRTGGNTTTRISARNRKTILEEWQKRYDAKSEPKG